MLSCCTGPTCDNVNKLFQIRDIESSHQRLDARLVPEKLGLHLTFVLLDLVEFFAQGVEKIILCRLRLLGILELHDKVLVLDSKPLLLLSGEGGLFFVELHIACLEI